jgi:kynurenine formamidase
MLYMSGQHGAPTIDAIGHIGRNLKLHGGVDAVQATSRPDGIGNDLGIDAFPRDLLLSRGVLLDVARVVANGGADPLPPGFEITGKHLEDAAQAHGVRVGRGDSVLIRTGWGQYFAKDNARYLGEKSPGPGVDAGRWLVAQGVRLTGTDTATYEVRPAVSGKELFPVHMLMIADNGIYLVENANLEDLGAARVHLFCLVVPPLRLRGASGSPLRMLALTPRQS